MLWAILALGTTAAAPRFVPIIESCWTWLWMDHGLSLAGTLRDMLLVVLGTSVALLCWWLVFVKKIQNKAGIHAFHWPWMVLLVASLALIAANFLIQDKLIEFGKVIESQSAVLFLKSIQPIGIIGGAIVVIIIFWRLNKDQKDRIDDEIARAWSLIALSDAPDTPRNVGARDAILTLKQAKRSLSNIALRNVSLKSIDLSSTENFVPLLIEAHFDSCELQWANFEGSTLHRAQFFSCRFQNTRFKGADLRYSRFFQDTHRSNWFRNVKMNGCNISGVRFIQIPFVNTDFSDCQFDPQNPPSFEGCTFDSRTVFPPAIDPNNFPLNKLRPV